MKLTNYDVSEYELIALFKIPKDKFQISNKLQFTKTQKTKIFLFQKLFVI